MSSMKKDNGIRFEMHENVDFSVWRDFSFVLREMAATHSGRILDGAMGRCISNMRACMLPVISSEWEDWQCVEKNQEDIK